MFAVIDLTAWNLRQARDGAVDREAQPRNARPDLPCSQIRPFTFPGDRAVFPKLWEISGVTSPMAYCLARASVSETPPWQYAGWRAGQLTQASMLNGLAGHGEQHVCERVRCVRDASSHFRPAPVPA